MKQRSVMRNSSIIWIFLWVVYFIFALFDVMGPHWQFYIALLVIGTCLFFISVGMLIRSDIKKHGNTTSLAATVVIYAIGMLLYYLLLYVIATRHAAG